MTKKKFDLSGTFQSFFVDTLDEEELAEYDKTGVIRRKIGKIVTSSDEGKTLPDYDLDTAEAFGSDD